MDVRSQVRPAARGRSAGRARIGVVWALTVLSACAPKPASQGNPPSPQASAPRPVLSSNLDQIQNQFAADPAAAKSKYDKVAVQFTAVANDVGAAGTQGQTISFRTAQHPQAIQAVFVKAGADGQAAVKPGDLVKARCDKISDVAGKLELRDCAFR